MPRLVISKGPGAGRDHAIGTECVVGRAADVDFVLEDQSTSRRHLRVSRDGEAYVVEDLGSRNGTSVNGSKVQRVALRDGDVIRAGATEMVFKQKDLVEASPAGSSGARPAVAVAPRAVVPPKAVVPGSVTRPSGVPSATPAEPEKPGEPPRPSAPAAPAAPAKKPLISPVPTRKRRGW